MAALEWLCHLIGVDSKKLTKHENCILEAELYRQIHQIIWETYKARYKDYFNLTGVNHQKGEAVMDLYVIRSLMNDLINSKAYTLSGIAYYTQVPEEIIENLLIAHKASPLVTFPRRLIELDKEERPNVYQDILRKLIFEQTSEQIAKG